MTSYNQYLMVYLKYPQKALGYLNELISGYTNDDDISKRIIVKGVGKVAKAFGGLDKLANEMNITVEQLHCYVSPHSTPRMGSIWLILKELDFDMCIHE